MTRRVVFVLALTTALTVFLFAGGFTMVVGSGHAQATVGDLLIHFVAFLVAALVVISGVAIGLVEREAAS